MYSHFLLPFFLREPNWIVSVQGDDSHCGVWNDQFFVDIAK
jgi:hypothetical protein